MMNEPAGLARSRSAPSSSCGSPIRGIGELDLMNAWLPAIGLHPVGHLGREPSGAEGVDPDPLARPLQRQLAGEVDDGALAGGVVRLLDGRGADMAEHRGDVDDRPPAGRDHRRRAQLGEVPDGGDVDLHRPAERVERLVLDADDLGDAGVVDEDPDACRNGRRSSPRSAHGRRDRTRRRPRRGRPARSSASRSSRSRRRAVTTTVAPAACSTRANRSPSPDDAPVTIATCPSRRKRDSGSGSWTTSRPPGVADISAA